MRSMKKLLIGVVYYITHSDRLIKMQAINTFVPLLRSKLHYDVDLCLQQCSNPFHSYQQFRQPIYYNCNLQVQVILV